MQPNQPIFNWVNFEDKKQNSVGSQNQLSEIVTPLYGLDPKGIRDWNEEF